MQNLCAKGYVRVVWEKRGRVYELTREKANAQNKYSCKKASTEKLTYILADNVQPCFKVWMYEGKVYASFRLTSIISLKDLSEKLSEFKVKCNVFRIEEVSRI